jgi:predicted small lipoprotein YifL
MNFDRRFNMKKVLSLVVVSLFLGLSLAGCMTPLEQAIEKNKQALEKIRKSHGT